MSSGQWAAFMAVFFLIGVATLLASLWMFFGAGGILLGIAGVSFYMVLAIAQVMES